MKVIKEESKTLELLMIDDDFFTYDTPPGIIFNEFNRLSGMDDNLFTYQVKIPKLSYSPSVEQQMDDFDNGNLDVYERKLCYDECEKMYAEAVIFVNNRLVRLIDVTVEQWLDLKYGDHTMVYGLDAGMEYDPSNVDFDEWLVSKFSNYMTMDWYTKNALWIYWTRDDDKEVITDDEPSNLGDGNLIEENGISQIFRIDTDIFHFETPLCEAFNEFNYLLKIDVDVLTDDIPRCKTYDEYKDAWIYEWNKDIPWVANMTWLDYGPWMEPSDDIKHIYKPFRFKNGHAKWPTYNRKKIERVDKEPSDNARTYHLPSNEWEDFERANHIGADANSNYNPYLDVSRIFNDHTGTNNDYETQEDDRWFDEHELMEDDDDDIDDLEDYLI
ncbi:hypothetical protein Tco_0438862 [Tanacetum coccineum]